MELFKRCKNKKVISTIIGIIISLGMFTNGHAQQTKEMNTTVKTKIETTSNMKTTKIKTKTKTTTAYKSNHVRKKMIVDATAYCGDTITSTGTKPIEGTTIAVDPTVIPYGTKVYIPEFNRVFTAEDCGSAIKGNRIDIFMNSYSRCMEFGYKTITIYVLENN